MRIPFALRRPWLLVRGTLTDRHRPDLRGLAAIEDPEQFVWAVLPHAARSFATSILMLPAAQARAAAVGYLYCRMLDTYEDLSEPGQAAVALAAFSARMEDLTEPPPSPDLCRDDRDRAHVLLVERCHLVDRVFESLREGFERVAAMGPVTMVLTLSNACPVGDEAASAVGDL